MNTVNAVWLKGDRQRVDWASDHDRAGVPAGQVEIILERYGRGQPEWVVREARGRLERIEHHQHERIEDRRGDGEEESVDGERRHQMPRPHAKSSPPRPMTRELPIERTAATTKKDQPTAAPSPNAPFAHIVQEEVHDRRGLRRHGREVPVPVSRIAGSVNRTQR